MDKYGIDSQKLIYHPQRVADWLAGKDIFPLYMEIGPVARCTHRCMFCAFDYTEYKGAIMSETFCKVVLEQAAELGLKSVMFAGEGEPLLHPSVIEMIAYSKMHNIDVSMTTNGVKLNEPRALNALPFLNWLRFSVDAATPETYAKVHGCKPADFETLIANIRRAVAIKKDRRCECTIGTQAVLIPQNQTEIVDLARLMLELGVDYFTVKPFSKHPSSICNFEMEYHQMQDLEQQLAEVAKEGLRIVFRNNAMEKLDEERPYNECFALSFATYMDAAGFIYPCSMFLGQKEYTFGNIYDDCIGAIWEGERRQQVLARLREEGVTRCREICRLDEVNRYLWTLKHPPEHVNFI